MKASLEDREALSLVSPTALSAYARTSGWSRIEAFGDHSDVYAGNGLPEIILPRTSSLGDYPNVVSHLIKIFTAVTELDELALYRDLVTCDRDVTRVRIPVDSPDGTISINEGANLASSARDMLLAAACALQDPQPLYRPGANKAANEILQRTRFGQTEQGSFVISLLSPVIPPLMQLPLVPNIESDDDPVDRRVTRRLMTALEATRRATERTIGGDSHAFSEAVVSGVSANLCEALVNLVEPFRNLDVSTTWARTRPMETTRQLVRFSNSDAPILREAARSFRSREPKLDERLFGSVQRLKRDESETDGTITLRASIDGKTQSVTAILTQSDYNQAIEAHKKRSPVIIEGDLDRFGQRWRLLNPRITEVILASDEPEEQ